jgi:hypothetical protein
MSQASTSHSPCYHSTADAIFQARAFVTLLTRRAILLYNVEGV